MNYTVNGAQETVGTNVSLIHALSVNDYIELFVFHDHGDTRTLLASEGRAYMAGFKLITS